ncbi:MAG: aminopeptidase [Clostridiales bacterium]|nr:aminopeptidase [Clostridiales bacterium]
MSELAYKRTNVYEVADEKLMKAIFDYAEGYKTFIDEGKTEREACAYVVEAAKAQGYKPFEFGMQLKAGDKVYYDNRGKNVYLIKIGTADVAKDGVRIIASHIDSPRIDLKQVPFYETDGIAFSKTHYYGGLRKYQWAAIPLALHGVVALADGSVLNVKIGEEENDPVFYISDLLPHLAAKQNAKPLGEAIGGEDLNIWLGNIPYVAADNEKDKTVKENLLKILHEKYGVKEEDFLCAELSLVPTFKAKDIGFDRALIGAYGHDDRVCSYPAYTALFDEESNEHTVMVILADKEEIGSEGTTGMQCALFTDLLDEIARSFNTTSAAVRAKSMCLSADVNAGYDPNYPDVCEKLNSAYLSHGAGITKFTGARGKSGSNDANAEFVGYLRKLFADNGVIWQTGEMGRVDVGGGGTVAKYIANMNIDTIDIGVPVISMHSPFEVISKADLYENYLAFRAFIK